MIIFVIGWMVKTCFIIAFYNSFLLHENTEDMEFHTIFFLIIFTYFFIFL